MSTCSPTWDATSSRSWRPCSPGETGGSTTEAGAPVACAHDEGDRQGDHEVVPWVICTDCGKPIVHTGIQFCVGPGYPDDVRRNSICAAAWRQPRLPSASAAPGTARRTRQLNHPRLGSPSPRSGPPPGSTESYLQLGLVSRLDLCFIEATSM